MTELGGGFRPAGELLRPCLVGEYGRLGQLCLHPVGAHVVVFRFRTTSWPVEPTITSFSLLVAAILIGTSVGKRGSSVPHADSEDGLMQPLFPYRALSKVARLDLVQRYYQ